MFTCFIVHVAKIFSLINIKLNALSGVVSHLSKDLGQSFAPLRVRHQRTLKVDGALLSGCVQHERFLWGTEIQLICSNFPPLVIKLWTLNYLAQGHYANTSLDKNFTSILFEVFNLSFPRTSIR